jgi:hypothetical protein
VSANEGRLAPAFGYVAGTVPKDAAFRNALDEEIEGMKHFLTPR